MSTLYPNFAAGIWTGSYNLNTATVKAVLVSSAYNSAHTVRSSLTGVAQSGGSDAFITVNNKSFTNGVFNTSDNVDTFTSVTAGGPYVAVVLFVDNGAAGSDTLIAYINNFDPVTPSGADVIVDWASGGIISLV